MNQNKIVNKLYAAYGTDSGILLGISDRQVVEAIVEFTLSNSEVADLTSGSPDSNNPTFKFLSEENQALKERNVQLLTALQGIINNWTERMGGDSEVWKDGANSVSGLGYYSPSASMVSSEFIARAKAAIKENTPVQGDIK